MTGYYSSAQICLNGHTINTDIHCHPEMNSKFCDQCGLETLNECPSCKQPIRGYHHIPGIVVMTQYNAPKFCHECGQQYPWTLRKLEAAKEIVKTSRLSEEEKRELEGNLDDVVKRTPRAETAAARAKELLTKAGYATGKAVRDIVVDITSETIKKTIWPNS